MGGPQIEIRKFDDLGSRAGVIKAQQIVLSKPSPFGAKAPRI